MADKNEIDDNVWDELSAPLQAAATKLGFNEQLWDNDQETSTCDLCWFELTSEQQKAARLLGYTPKTWDDEEGSIQSDDSEQDVDHVQESGHEHKSCDGEESPELDNRINVLRSEIDYRKKKLKRLLRKKEGTAYARMLRRHEDCVNLHLEQSLKYSHLGSSQQNQFPSLKLNPLQLIVNNFLNEYYHTLPGCVAITLHCILYSTLTDLTTKLITELCHHVTKYFSGWHIINNNFDDSAEEHLFFFVAIVFVFSTLRVTGGLFEWEENRASQRKKHFHFRNRWHMRCWDMRTLNWFSGGGIQEMFDDNIVTAATPNNAMARKWGPRLKAILNVFCFFILYGCADLLIEEFGSKLLLNQKEMILEGLPSRQLHQQRSRNSTDGQEEKYCINSGEGQNGAAEGCIADLEMDFISDIWNWVKNADRCGWVYDGKDDDGCDDCQQKQDNESGILSIVKDRESKTFKPWKQSDKEWIQMLNVRDDEYLRATVSMESYYSLVGDPDAHFIDPLRELVFYAAITGISLGCLYWFDITFQLI